MRRIGNPAYQVLGRFETIGVYDHDIHGKGNIANRAANLYAFLRAGSPMSRAMSLSGVISSVAADPKRIILSGLATPKMRRTISPVRESSILILSIILETDVKVYPAGSRAPDCDHVVQFRT